MKKYMHDFKVFQNKRLSTNYFVLELLCPGVLTEILPGQFAEVRIDDSPFTYLRRPFSIYDADYENNVLKMLLKTVGNGTASLQKLEKGDTLNLIYPLGNSFSIPKGNKVLLVGGGVGIAPMFLLAKFLKSNGKEVDILIGGRTKDDIIEPDIYRPYARVFITTDDGSLGEKGMVTQHSLFLNENSSYSGIYTCGPDQMMRSVANLASLKGIPCEVSLENLMACGIGACLCCIVETDSGNKTTCVEGPVFDSHKLTGWNSV
jgi:dihydroorotate dehydrogenase electron transfer subunit